MVVSLFWTELGIFFRIDGGWLDVLLTYATLLLGFLFGLNEPSVDNVTSKTLTVCPFCSMLILRWLDLKMRFRPFSILLIRGPFELSM